VSGSGVQRRGPRRRPCPCLTPVAPPPGAISGLKSIPGVRFSRSSAASGSFRAFCIAPDRLRALPARQANAPSWWHTLVGSNPRSGSSGPYGIDGAKWIAHLPNSRRRKTGRDRVPFPMREIMPEDWRCTWQMRESNPKLRAVADRRGPLHSRGGVSWTYGPGCGCHFIDHRCPPRALRRLGRGIRRADAWACRSLPRRIPEGNPALTHPQPWNSLGRISHGPFLGLTQ
jgi:hypothetical protein